MDIDKPTEPTNRQGKQETETDIVRHQYKGTGQTDREQKKQRERKREQVDKQNSTQHLLFASFSELKMRVGEGIFPY